MLVDPVELSVGRPPEVRARREGIAHQRVAGERLLLAVDVERVLEPVGEHRVERQDAADAVGVLEVDELLGALVEGERPRPPEVAQEVAVVGVLVARRQEPLGLVVLEPLPPELEEEDPVLVAGDHLVDPVAEGLRRARLGVGREPERGIAEQHVEALVERLEAVDHGQELGAVHRRVEPLAQPLELGDRGVEVGQPPGDHLLGGRRQQLGEVPGALLEPGGDGGGVGDGHAWSAPLGERARDVAG